MKDFKEKFLLILGVIFVVALVSFLYGAILMWLWNAVIVVVFAAPALSYWQAYGICIICNLLFKSSKVPTKKE
jgi:hypothetical protein